MARKMHNRWLSRVKNDTKSSMKWMERLYTSYDFGFETLTFRSHNHDPNHPSWSDGLKKLIGQFSDSFYILRHLQISLHPKKKLFFNFYGTRNDNPNRPSLASQEQPCSNFKAWFMANCEKMVKKKKLVAVGYRIWKSTNFLMIAKHGLQ